MISMVPIYGLNLNNPIEEYDKLLNGEDCVKRIQGDESGHKHCTGQYFDYWSCVDKCVAPKLFTKLK
ncbi:hypothetical protein ACLB2K_050599 [Fragaria x ananassa]